MLLIINYANQVMGTPPVMPPIASDASAMPPSHWAPSVTSDAPHYDGGHHLSL